MGKASAAAGARLMEDVERALARVDPSASHAGASPSQRRVVTALHGTRGLARLDLERRLVSRAACDALAELQRRLDAAKAETRDAVAACRVARAETETAARDRETERREWLANRDAVRKEIALARDRVAAVKDEHRDVLLKLERERRNVKLAGEETSAARDELARALDANELLKRRLARARAENARARAENAARDDAVDTALAANARNAAIAAREALKRADDEEEVFPLINGFVRSPSTSARRLGERVSDDDDERRGDRAGREVGTDLQRVSAPPSPSAPTTVSQTTRSRADWARAYAELVTEVDAARARAEKAESALDQSKSSANEPNRANASVDARDWKTRALAAEAKVVKLARLNAGLLDRLGEAVGAAPTSAKRGGPGETTGEAVSETTTAAKTRAENSRKETYGRQTSSNDSERLRKIETLRALESEVKAMDAAYRETMETIARESAVPVAAGCSDPDPETARRLDAAAARANALEDAIVRKVEEVQRLREL
jgi:hypothetical protein